MDFIAARTIRHDLDEISKMEFHDLFLMKRTLMGNGFIKIRL